MRSAGQVEGVLIKRLVRQNAALHADEGCCCCKRTKISGGKGGGEVRKMDESCAFAASAVGKVLPALTKQCLGIKAWHARLFDATKFAPSNLHLRRNAPPCRHSVLVQLAALPLRREYAEMAFINGR